ncbi:vacuolar-sorting protein SNF8-like [Babylonia areolata]|uniref:vacuolar-sorting protein SNF8-like n=1 Tax=Babylonia areolata TaxID=304850 RepID=UPI003FD5EB4A
MRRGTGIGAIKNKNLAQARYKDKGSEIAEDQFSQMTKQMEVFKTNLEEFAAKHKDDIRKDPQFRLQFQEMCASIGVDPLASSKGFWAEMLGVGDFYYELGVQIVEVCLATSHRNGGLISLDELRDRVVASRGRTSQDISLDDMMRAIRKLRILGNGFTVLAVGNMQLVQSVPGELTMDHTNILQLAQKSGYVSHSQLLKDLKWEDERSHRALDFLVKEGMAWVDDQDSTERLYWFPSLFPAASAS